MTAPRRTRRRDAQRPPQRVVLRAACLLLGFAAAALVVSAALATHEPAPEKRPLVAQASLGAEAAAPATRPVALPQSRVSPSSVDAKPVAATPGFDAARRPAGDRPRPGTERAFYEQDLQLAKCPGALAERAQTLFVGGEGSDPERVAALRALWDSATPGAEEWFALALRPPPDAPAPQGALSVGEFALGFLRERAAREPAALELLTQLASDVTAPRALRRGAAVGVAATADPLRLRRLATDVAADDEPDFRAALARAAARNDAAEAATLFTPGEP
jgi:hypothetical protein